MAVELRYLRLPDELPQAQFHTWCKLLPPSDQQKVKRYRAQGDQWRALVGRLLLLQILMQQFDKPQNVLENIQTDHLDKPFFLDGPYFNLSHTGSWLMAAVSEQGPIGVDIEVHRKVNFDHLRPQMKEQEWELIENDADPLALFFDYWVKKESVVKADGRGIRVNLANLNLEGNHAELDGNHWYLLPYSLAADCPGCLCSAQSISGVTPKEETWQSFIEYLSLLSPDVR
ncbi:MAG: 4'-phosphopantetheinyl transferase superfamily protein [Bacteroidota bacterium]